MKAILIVPMFCLAMGLATGCTDNPDEEQQPKVEYIFAEGLLIRDFSNNSCHEGQMGKWLSSLSNKLDAKLTEEVLKIEAEQLHQVGQQQREDDQRSYDAVGGKPFRRVRRVFNQLKPHLQRRDLKYEVRLVQHRKLPSLVNAWVNADGLVLITKPMVDFVRSDDELAFILSHELSHLENWHPDKQLALDGVISGAIPDESIIKFLKKSADKILNSMNQRDEVIADRAALFLMNEAGYDPQAALDVFRRLELATNEGEQANVLFHNFFSSHPYNFTRFDCINRYIYESRIENDFEEISLR